MRVGDRGAHAFLIVRALNGLLGVPQEAIARSLSVSFSTVNAWATKRRAPHASQYVALRNHATALLSTFSLDSRSIVAQLAQLYVNVPPLVEADTNDPLSFLLTDVVALKSAHGKSREIVHFLLKTHRSWDAMANVPPQKLESQVQRAGLGSVKLQTTVKLLDRLITRFGRARLDIAKMSDTEAEEFLLSLPAVDIRIARRVLLLCFRRSVFPVDADVYRVAIRLGLLDTSRSTRDASSAFDSLLSERPEEAGNLYMCLRTIAATCTPQNPECSACPTEQRCPSKNIHIARKRRTLRRILPNQQLTAIDLFAGCGGLSLGLEDSGFRLAYALDWDKHACETHAYNFPKAVVECADVRNITAEAIVKAAGSVDLLAGGPNCQGVSERGLRSPDDPRNFMFPEFYRLVSQLRPRAFIMENVPGLAHRHNYSLLKTIFGSFESLGYKCSADVLLAAHYGVPQLRYRFVLIGLLDRLPTFPRPTHADSLTPTLFLPPFVTVWDAISDLPFVDYDRQSDSPLPYGEPPRNNYQLQMRGDCTSVTNHVCSATEPINLERASYIPEGGNWKDIPPELLPDRFYTCRMTDHSTTYARLRRDFPAYTITSLFGNITAGAFLHPLINRALTIREGARLQSFPDRFLFRGSRNSQYRQIGNAVPPLLARAIGTHVRELILGNVVDGVSGRIDSRLLNNDNAWDALPVLTPRFKHLFGTGTRWPRGWGAEPNDYSTVLDSNYRLKGQQTLAS